MIATWHIGNASVFFSENKSRAEEPFCSCKYTQTWKTKRFH